MYEPFAVNRRQCFANLDADEGGFLRTHGTRRIDDRRQGAAANQFHPETDTTIVNIRAVHGDNVGMLQAREHSAFAQDRLDPGIVGGEARLGELERDFAVENAVARAVDVTEGAFADLFEEVEVAPALAGQVLALHDIG